MSSPQHPPPPTPPPQPLSCTTKPEWTCRHCRAQAGESGDAPPARVVPAAEWQDALRAALAAHPAAIVGEVGVDRAATIPGSKARSSWEHQLELLRWQVGFLGACGGPTMQNG